MSTSEVPLDCPSETPASTWMANVPSAVSTSTLDRSSKSSPWSESITCERARSTSACRSRSRPTRPQGIRIVPPAASASVTLVVDRSMIWPGASPGRSQGGLSRKKPGRQVQSRSGAWLQLCVLRRPPATGWARKPTSVGVRRPGRSGPRTRRSGRPRRPCRPDRCHP